MTLTKEHVGGYEKESDALIARLMTDTEFFARSLFEAMEWNEVAPLSEIELDILDFMVDPKGAKKRETLAVRGIGKTHLVVVRASRSLFRDANRKIIVFGKSQTEAKKTLSIARDCIEQVWFLKPLLPKMGDKDSATEFMVGPARRSRQASFTALGIDGAIPGNRAHDMIVDDAETPENTQTDDSRIELFGKFIKIDALLYPDRPVKKGGAIDPTCVNVIGTRHHDQDSVYDKLVGLGYMARSWTLTQPTPEQRERIVNLAPIIATSTDEPGALKLPHRFDADFVAQKLEMGQPYYDQQFQQCGPSKTASPYALSLSDLIVVDAISPDKAPLTMAYAKSCSKGSLAYDQVDIPILGHPGDKLYRPLPEPEETRLSTYTGVKAWIDPAGKGTDLTGFAIAAHIAGTLYMPIWRGLRGGASAERIDEILILCKQWRVRELFYESNIDTFNTYGQMLHAALTRHTVRPGDPHIPQGWSCIIIPRHATGRKEHRMADTLGPATQNHRVVVAKSELIPDRALQPHQQLQHQISRLTRSPGCLREDGALDAGASVIAEWRDALGHDPKKMAARRLDDEARMHIDKALRDTYGLHAKKQPRAWSTRR